MTQPDASTATASPLPFRFTGTGGEYFKIWIVNLCLTILTLGIYSAWAKVRRNRYFYGNTTLAGSAFEYLAKPGAILKGRLIAFGFFVLFAVSQHVSLTMYFIMLGLLMFAMPWFIVRSLAFRARNTAYRNIRFNFKAAYGQAFLEFILLPIVLGVLTLGLIFPYVMFRQKKLLVEKSAYGTSPFSFATSVGSFYAVFGMSILILIGLVLLFVLLGGALGMGAAMAGAPILILLVVYPLMIAMYVFLFAYFNAKIGNLVYNGSSMNGHRLQADLQVGALFGLYLKNILGIIFTLGFYIPWAKVAIAQYWAEHVRLLPAGDLNSFIAEQQSKISAAGEEVGEMFDFDVGL